MVQTLVSSCRQLPSRQLLLLLVFVSFPAVDSARADSEVAALEKMRRGKYMQLTGLFGEYDLSHAAIIWSLDVSSDGSYAVTGSADRAAKLWNLRTRTEVKAFVGHDSDVTSVAISPDNSRLLTGSKDGTVRLWDIASGEQIALFDGHEDWVLAVAFSPDGLLAASGGRDKTVMLWDVASGNQVGAMKGHTGFVSALEFSPDGRRLASSSYDQSIRLWNVQSRTPAKVFHSNQGWLLTVAFANNGRSLLASAADNIIREWRIDSETQEQEYVGHTGWVYSIIGVPGSNTFYTASLDGTIRSWSYGESKPLKSIVDSQTPINDAVLSFDGSVFYAASGSKIRIFDAASGRELAIERRGHAGAVRSVVSAARGKEIITAGSDGAIIVWDAKRRKESRKIFAENRPSGGYQAMSYSRSGDILAVGGGDGSISFFDYKSGELEAFIPQHEATISDLKYSPDGRYLISSSADRTFALLKVKNGLPVERSGGVLDYIGKAFFQAFGSHKGRVNSIDISPDSSRIISGSNDGAIRLWDADREQWLHTYREHRTGVSAVRFLNGKTEVLSGAISGLVRLLNLEEGRNELVFTGHRGAVVALDVGPQGRLYTASVDSSVKVWDLKSAEELDSIDLRGVTDLPQALTIVGDSLYLGTLRGVLLEFKLKSPGKKSQAK